MSCSFIFLLLSNSFFSSVNLFIDKICSSFSLINFSFSSKFSFNFFSKSSNCFSFSCLKFSSLFNLFSKFFIVAFKSSPAFVLSFFTFFISFCNCSILLFNSFSFFFFFWDICSNSFWYSFALFVISLFLLSKFSIRSSASADFASNSLITCFNLLFSFWSCSMFSFNNSFFIIFSLSIFSMFPSRRMNCSLLNDFISSCIITIRLLLLFPNFLFFVKGEAFFL